MVASNSGNAMGRWTFRAPKAAESLSLKVSSVEGQWVSDPFLQDFMT